MPEGSGGAYSGIGMQIRVEFNLNPSEFVPNSKLCEFERILFKCIHNESF